MKIGRLEIVWHKRIDDREWQSIADSGRHIEAIKKYRDLYKTKKGFPDLKESRDIVYKYMGRI